MSVVGLFAFEIRCQPKNRRVPTKFVYDLWCCLSISFDLAEISLTPGATKSENRRTEVKNNECR